jgi:hypothetical protein
MFPEVSKKIKSGKCCRAETTSIGVISNSTTWGDSTDREAAESSLALACLPTPKSKTKRQEEQALIDTNELHMFD